MTLRQIYKLFKILFEKMSEKFVDNVNIPCTMLKNGQAYLKILQYWHLKIFKVVAILQRYA